MCITAAFWPTSLRPLDLVASFSFEAGTYSNTSGATTNSTCEACDVGRPEGVDGWGGGWGGRRAGYREAEGEDMGN